MQDNDFIDKNVTCETLYVLKIAHCGILDAGNCGRLRIKDMNEDACPGRGVRFSHDVFDVFFHCLFSNLKRVRDFFIRPALC